MTISIHAVEGNKLVAVPLAEASRHAFVWIDADERTPGLEQMLRGLGIHPLTLEDVFEQRATPKVEDFGEYLYVLAHTAKLEGDKLRVLELDLVLEKTWLVTHHPPELDVPARVRDELSRTNGKPLDGPHLAHLLLDRLVDETLPVMDAFDERITALEEQALRRRPRRATMTALLQTRRRLHAFRRLAVHQREMLVRLARGEFTQLIPAEMLPFFRDVYDHMVRLADLTDDARELVGGAIEAYLSMVSNRMNEIMKVLTMIATVFLPISFIAGVYGMNFTDMPELHWKYGYPFAIGLMFATATGLLLWFRKQGWFD